MIESIAKAVGNLLTGSARGLCAVFVVALYGLVFMYPLTWFYNRSALIDFSAPKTSYFAAWSLIVAAAVVVVVTKITMSVARKAFSYDDET